MSHAMKVPSSRRCARPDRVYASVWAILRPMGDGHRSGLQIVIMLRVGARSARTHDEGDAAIGTRVLLMNFPGRHHVDVAGADRMPADQVELGRPDMRWAAVGAFIAIHRLPPL